MEDEKMNEQVIMTFLYSAPLPMSWGYDQSLMMSLKRKNIQAKDNTV